MTTNYLSPPWTLRATNLPTLFIISRASHIRDQENDSILEKMGLRDPTIIASVLESIFYSPNIISYYDLDDESLDDVWQYSLPYSIYENGNSFEKLIISNSEAIHDYLYSIYLYYKQTLFKSICGVINLNQHRHLGALGGTVYEIHGSYLICFGDLKDEWANFYHIRTFEGVCFGKHSGI